MPVTISGKPVVEDVIPNFDSFAAANPWIGAKIGTVQFTTVNLGAVQQYQNATVYCAFEGQPFEVHGAIRDKYNYVGGPDGFLGFPITNETGTPDAKGRFNHFVSGSIYFHPSIGAAFEVHGAIRAKWASLGYEGFGYPFTDETGTPDGIGRFNHFRTFMPNGSIAESSIYWTSDIGAHEIYGAIRLAWAAIGWETSFLGYPVSGEYASAGGRRNDFQNGYIFWSAATGVQVQPQWFSVNAPSITFGGGNPVGGFGNLTVFSDGTTHFKGHLRVSGAPSYDCLAVFTVKDTANNAYAASSSGHLNGTDESGSRDLDWDIWGKNDAVRQNWAKIRDGGIGGYQVKIDPDLTADELVNIVKAIVGFAEKLVELIGGGSDDSSDSDYNPDVDPDVDGVSQGPDDGGDSGGDS
jgi:hypothetical protein